MRKKKKTASEVLSVAVQDGIIAIEDLPYPCVLYPGHYGTFFAFKEDIIDSVPYLCECCKSAVINFIKIQDSSDECSYNKYINYTHLFPEEFLLYLKTIGDGDFGRIIIQNSDVLFKPGLCHSCNLVQPTYAYCMSMYGNQFTQHYGWYVNQKELEFGIYDSYYLAESVPYDILHAVKRRYALLNSSERSAETIHECGDLFAKIHNYIENIVREHFGKKRIGEKWTTETFLYTIIQDIYGCDDVLFHFRPRWLDHLELDIYIPHLKLAFEYQGIQHYKPIKHWGGEEGLEKRRLNDVKKKKLCEEHGVILIYFTYQDKITYNDVLERIQDYLPTYLKEQQKMEQN